MTTFFSWPRPGGRRGAWRLLVAFALGWLGGRPAAAQPTPPPFPLGAFVGGPNGSDPAVQAQLDAHFDRFTQLMGAAPVYMNCFLNHSKSINDWPTDGGWVAWSCEQAARFRPLVPVIGLPMATDADASNPGPVFRKFATGQYDVALRGMVRAWTDHGFTTLYVRPGYEMNETFMPWYAGRDAPTRADWVAAFRHIADVLHAVPGVRLKIIWNPNVRNANGDLDVRTLYPGDSYVDVVGADQYNPLYPYDLYSWARNDGTFDATFAQWVADPVNRTHYWNYPSGDKWNPTGNLGSNPFSLQNAVDLARLHGKPFALPETGAGGDGAHGPTDDPAFPEWLAGKLAGAGVPIELVNIWDLDAGDADWTFSGPGRNGVTRPLEAAAWARYFGARPTTPGPAAGVVSGATYQLLARHSGKALEVDAATPGDGARAQQWDYLGGAHQQWVVELQSDGAYTLTHRGTTQRLEVAGNGGNNGDVVQQWTAHPGDAQRWVIVPTDNGYYKLLHKGTTKGLDVAAAGAGNGARVHQWDYVGGPNQQWRLVRVGPALASTGAAGAGAAGQLFPNPATDRVTVSLPVAADGPVRVDLFDGLGRRVAGATHPATAGRNAVEVAVAALPVGMYSVRVLRSTGECTVHRLVVEK